MYSIPRRQVHALADPFALAFTGSSCGAFACPRFVQLPRDVETVLNAAFDAVLAEVDFGTFDGRGRTSAASVLLLLLLLPVLRPILAIAALHLYRVAWASIWRCHWCHVGFIFWVGDGHVVDFARNRVRVNRHPVSLRRGPLELRRRFDLVAEVAGRLDGRPALLRRAPASLLRALVPFDLVEPGLSLAHKHVLVVRMSSLWVHCISCGPANLPQKYEVLVSQVGPYPVQDCLRKHA